jgi:SagB-type dehydrogenase family enzyme
MDRLRGLNAVDSYETGKNSISEIYHENSKLNRINGMIFARRFDAIRNNPYLQKAMSKTYKTYPNHKSVMLERDFVDSRKTFEEVIGTRRTTRAFSGEHISLQELSKILYFSYGINFSFKAFESHSLLHVLPQFETGVKAIDLNVTADGYQAFRFPASAGGLYPLEIYLVAHRVEDLVQGLYHYNVREHKLEVLEEGDLLDKVMDLTFNQDWQLDVCVHFIITAIFSRTKFKYGERGYRFICIDAGHFMQNLYLAANSLDLGAAAIGGFYDDEVDEFVDVDGVN